MLSRHSAGSHHGNELTHNSSYIHCITPISYHRQPLAIYNKLLHQLQVDKVHPYHRLLVYYLSDCCWRNVFSLKTGVRLVFPLELGDSLMKNIKNWNLSQEYIYSHDTVISRRFQRGKVGPFGVPQHFPKTANTTATRCGQRGTMKYFLKQRFAKQMLTTFELQRPNRLDMKLS